jgi:hypothetical protein
MGDNASGIIDAVNSSRHIVFDDPSILLVYVHVVVEQGSRDCQLKRFIVKFDSVALKIDV